MKNIRLLFLGAGPAMPNGPTYFDERYKHFSQYYSGHIISPVAGPEHLNIDKIAAFKFHPFLYYHGNSITRNILIFVKTIIKAIKLFCFDTKYDVIISPSPLTIGLAALIVGKITKSKVIIEVNGNFESAFRFGRKGEIKPSFVDKVKNTTAKSVIPFILEKADMVKLVYKDQLKLLGFNHSKTINAVSFPNFVPISYFLKSPKKDGHYILLLGFPWYLKGVDILIKAFNKISSEFPAYRLKIVGWCPEGREFFENLAKENQKIDLSEPVHYDQVIKLMTECSLYVLASRTDSSPRVLREAMASKKPIIASNIDGVPELIKDGYNGLLFEKENVDDLADKIRMLLSDKRLAKQIAENGFRYVCKNLSEERYITNYKQMVEMTFDREKEAEA